MDEFINLDDEVAADSVWCIFTHTTLENDTQLFREDPSFAVELDEQLFSACNLVYRK